MPCSLLLVHPKLTNLHINSDITFKNIRDSPHRHRVLVPFLSLYVVQTHLNIAEFRAILGVGQCVSVLLFSASLAERFI